MDSDPTVPEAAIEAALDPGRFVTERRCLGFVEDLEQVRDRIVALAHAGQAPRSVSLLELFIAGCYVKAEEIDDSNGDFGNFVEDLFCDWVRARQEAGLDANETAELLISWMEKDDYGFCYKIQNQAAEAFDGPGLRAFEDAIRARWGLFDRADYRRRWMVEILKAIHLARGDPGAYVAACEEDGEIGSEDCERLARLYADAEDAEEALSWADRGLSSEVRGAWPSRTSSNLGALRRRILDSLGRRDEALRSAWEDYCRIPSRFSYEELMAFVPAEATGEWHGRALDALEEANLRSRVDLLVETDEVDRLARTVESASDEELLALSHYSAEPAAHKLAPGHPLLAAQLHCFMARRILDAAKSAWYHAALDHLERARQIFVAQGKTRDWNALVEELRARHSRKRNFMPGFERLVAGNYLILPSFLDRARSRWRNTGDAEGEVS